MKFNFKIQQYQTDAVDAVVTVFNGQGFHDKINYIRDLGKMKSKDMQMTLGFTDEEMQLYDPTNDTGYKNELVELSDEQLLSNIQALQRQNNIKLSNSLVKDLGRCSLDIEMETGTGKTYAYIKTMFELNKKYGWSKFIVVVPSIAIREGVKKSFEITADHFMEHYGKKARFFIYNSSNLNQLDNFSSSSGINVMIINTQAFASSLKEDGRSKEARIIYSKRDEFGSRRPIDVIKANRPIIILDEPQKMGGEVTQKALKNFNPLFSLNYSATHAKHHNLIYVLDALDAFNKKLVKKIEVKGFEVKNFRGTDSYLYLEQIVLSSKKPPMAKIELEIGYNKSINRESRILGVGDDLYYVSQEMEQYKGYTISEIDPLRGTVTFTNGEVISTGDIVGDISEKDMRRIQIRETILSHFEKEEKLFDKGIKCLSLFFIDEVAKYRQYDENGDEVIGEYGKMFEQEYINVLNEYVTLLDTPYQRYLKSTCSDVEEVHKGYFSIDKKGHAIDSKVKRGSEFSDDISAYDLILKNKERLLSFDEPTRFIFSHSALREGWDNPNVFQICTLKHSDSNTAKRQEVGRGLRLCVNQNGNRMDVESCGETVHDINVLTVVASESYKTFVTDLQSDIKTVLYDRPTVATSEYFKGKYIKVDDVPTLIDDETANAIEFYLIQNGYVDMKRKVTDKYRQEIKSGTVAELPDELKPMAEGIRTLIQSVYDDSILQDMFTDGHETKVKDNPLNDNFAKKEFQALWREINHKYAYTVEFDSDELIKKATLNDRGKPLSDADIFKAQFYKHFSKLGKKEEFIAQWKKLEELCERIFHPISGTPMDELFTRYMYFVRAKMGIVSSTTEALRKFYEKNSYALLKDTNTLTELIVLAEFWEDVSNQDTERFSNRVLKQFFVLNYAPNGMWTYFVSVYFMQNKDDEGLLDDEKFYTFLQKITGFIWTYAITNPGVNALRTPVYAEMVNIVNDKPVEFSKYKFDADTIRSIFDNFSFNNARPITKAMIAWWAYQNDKQPLLSLETTFEIEHIYARNRNEKENSLTDARNVESLGNKALLEKRINIRASDYRFTDKKKYYEGFTNSKGQVKEGTGVVELLDLTATSTDFTENDIIDRYKKMIDCFINYLQKNSLIK